MLTLPPSVRIFVSRQPIDMRKGFDSLAQLARSHLGGDPLSGHLFVFRSKRGDRLMVLYWDHDTYASGSAVRAAEFTRGEVCVPSICPCTKCARADRGDDTDVKLGKI